MSWSIAKIILTCTVSKTSKDTISSLPPLQLHCKFIEQIHIRKTGVKRYTRLKSSAQLTKPIFSPGDYVMAQLFEALRYTPEGRGFDSRLSLEFFIDIILPAALWPCV